MQAAIFSRLSSQPELYPMTIFIRQAVIADPRSSWYGQQVDLVIKEGEILNIALELPATSADVIIKEEGLLAAPGFVDVFSHFGDPGLEYKETIATGVAAAAAGGYTKVMVLPNNEPVTHNKSQVSYLLQKSNGLPVDILPIGAISRNCEGKELAEMYDMYQSGAIAFSDGIHPVQNSQVLLKALQYVKAFDGVVVQIPDEQHLSKYGLINEGIISTQLGLAGKPALAETLMLSRDIELLRYTESKLHVTGISTAAALPLIRKAKEEGLQITCSVTPYHLHFSDEDLIQYNTHLKVNPPLRTQADVLALREALLDGTIDCIASHHLPHEQDSKMCEFEYAKYGMEGLESCFRAVLTAVPQLTMAQWVHAMAIHPANIFGIECAIIEIGAAANCCLLTLAEESIFTTQHIKSASANNAFVGKQLLGNIKGIIHRNQIVLHH